MSATVMTAISEIQKCSSSGLQMEEDAMGLEKCPSEAGEGRGADAIPQPPGGSQHCQHSDFTPVRFARRLQAPELQGDRRMLVSAIKGMMMDHKHQRKLKQVAFRDLSQ